MKKILTSILLAVACIFIAAAVGCGKTHKVTFDANGGTFADGRSTIELKVKDGEAVDIDGQPTKNDANFLYWAVNGNEYIFSTPVTDDLTVTAVWQEIYTVTFKAEGGTFSNGTNVYSVKVTEGEAVSIPEDVPTMEKGKFLCWTLNGSEYAFSTPVTGNITLVASYKGLGSYSVTFEDGEGYKVKGIENNALVKEDDVVTFTLDIGAFYTAPTHVCVNGNDILASEDGSYSFTVLGDSEITVLGVSEDVSNMVGSGTEESPYFITRPIDLIYIADQVNNGMVAYVNAYYQLMNDIDVKGEELKVIGDGSAINVNGQMINTYFSGYVNGMGNTISNYVINSQSNYSGLFGEVVCDPYNGHYGTIYDLHLDNFRMNVSFPGGENPSLSCGALIGYGIGANVYLCSATNGAIMVDASDEYYSSIIGGLVGVQEALVYESVIFNSNLAYCNTSAEIYVNSGKALFAGGIVGYMYSSNDYAIAYTTNCYATGYVSGAVAAGGVVGCIGQYNSVTNSYSTSNVRAVSTITNTADLDIYCHAYAGGVVGMAENDTFINGCFATGNQSAKSNVSRVGYELTDGICAGHIDDYATTIKAEKGTQRNCYYAAGGKDTVNGIDLKSSEFLKKNLGWMDYDWVFSDTEYPVVNLESSDVSFNLTFHFSGRLVGGLETYVVLIEGSYLPMAHLYANAYAYEYVVAESGEISYGFFFDEALTQKVPRSFVVTSDITVYAGFADYSEVAGTYLISGGYSEAPCYIYLGTDGVITYTDGSALSTAVYVYNGEDIIIEGARLARYLTGELTAEYLALYDFKAVIERDSDGAIGLKIYDGNYFTEDDCLYATSSVGVDKLYYNASTGESYQFYADFTGFYKNGTEYVYFEYEYDGNQITVTLNAMTLTVDLGDGTATVGGVVFTQSDAFMGKWEASAGINKTYTFDGMGNWSYESYGYNRENTSFIHKEIYNTDSGKYSLNDDGSINLLGTGMIARLTEEGFLEIETDVAGSTFKSIYYAESSFAGEWRDNTNGATLYLFGMAADGVGEGYVEYDSGYYYYLTYSKESDSVITVYSGMDFFGTFSYNINSDALRAALYRGETEAITSGFSFMRKDAICGEWISDDELFGQITLNGFGSYENGKFTVGVENGTQVSYLLENSTQNGRFEYNGTVYYITYDDVTESLTVTAGGASVVLERKDAYSDFVFVDANGSEYVFDGRGNLSAGGNLTVTAKDGSTAKYEYKTTANGADVFVQGEKVGAVTEEKNAYCLTVGEDRADLYIKTPYTGEWAVSGNYGTIVIGGVSLDGKIDGSYLGRRVEFEYTEEYLVFFYLTYNKYVFILEDDNANTDEVEYCLVVSDYSTIVQNAYSVCAPMDEMFGEWKENGMGKVLRFDGIVNSNYVNGNAQISFGSASTDYFYRLDANGGIMMWSQGVVGTSTIIYRLEWCNVNEYGAYVSKDGARAFKLIEVDTLYLISATDVATGNVYTFDGEGTVECNGEKYSYRITRYADGEIVLVVTKNGKQYIATVYTFNIYNVTIEFGDEVVEG